jgi:hypothetical protein
MHKFSYTGRKISASPRYITVKGEQKMERGTKTPFALSPPLPPVPRLAGQQRVSRKFGDVLRQVYFIVRTSHIFKLLLVIKNCQQDILHHDFGHGSRVTKCQSVSHLHLLSSVPQLLLQSLFLFSPSEWRHEHRGVASSILVQSSSFSKSSLIGYAYSTGKI